MATLEDALAEAERNNRACPRPQAWDALWNLLPDRQRKGGGWEPPIPLILGGWWESSDFEKAQRLRDHIQWANSHGALDVVLEFMRELPETEWHHHGD